MLLYKDRRMPARQFTLTLSEKGEPVEGRRRVTMFVPLEDCLAHAEAQERNVISMYCGPGTEEGGRKVVFISFRYVVGIRKQESRGWPGRKERLGG
jgi:hypothetical protein